MIKAIFYARFHPEKGNIIAHQVPPGSITTSQPASRNNAASPPPILEHEDSNDRLSSVPVAIGASDEYPLFDFNAVDSLLIPRQEFCDRLVTVCTNKYRIIGHPVCINNERYERNEFIFNLAVVLDEEAEFSAYTSIVRKLARMLRQLEEQSRFLSREERGDDGVLDLAASIGSLRSVRSIERNMESSVGELERLPLLDELVAEDRENGSLSGSGLLDAFEREQGKKVYALCEMIMEDLNNYCECMIPIDPSNTINLKLFPNRPPPAPVYAWHVPLPTVDLTTLTSSSSDLTLTRLTPFIDGIASVSQIAQLADTDLGLTRKAIQHLLYYGCVLLLDIFQFGAVYAPTPEMGDFIEDEEAQGEAVRYVCMGTYRRLQDGEGSGADGKPVKNDKEEWGWRSREVGVDKARLVYLYTTLRQGLTLKHWCSEHGILLSGIDVRRFVTFGIIKGFLYRVHKYVVAPSVVGGGLTPESHHSRSQRSLGGKRVDFHPQHRESIAQADAEVVDRRYSIPAGDRHGGRESIGGYYSRRPSVDGEAGDGATHNVTGKAEDALPLTRYVDGLHCLDEVCTELGMSEKRVLEKMKASFGDLYVVHR